MKPKALFCWSGGKDSALALHLIRKEGQYEVIALFTTFNSRFGRVSMHGVREELVEMQARAAGLPLLKMYVSEGTNDEYERGMEIFLLAQRERGIHHVIFGDIFLEDLRAYRENNLARVDMKAVFPLWKKDTSLLIREFIGLGFRTITCCINDAFLTKEHAGREISTAFIEELPENVDPCGENGEYHSFCFDGPIFSEPVKIRTGEKQYHALAESSITTNTKGFWYCDLLPDEPL